MNRFMGGKSPDYRVEIEGLRGVAVLMVVIFHAYPKILPGGYLGVDVFFVISGFLITRLIHKQLNESRFTFQEFYARRARRLLPALVLVLSTVLFVGWYLLLPTELRALGKHAAAGACFVSNFFVEMGYFDPEASQRPLLHLWSLGVEEQFYLFWPLFLLCLYRLRVSMGKAILLVVILSLFLFWIRRAEPLNYYAPWSRLWELGLGGGLVFWKVPKFRMAFAQRILSNRALVFFGAISYPLYLWHWPVLFFFDKVSPSPVYKGMALIAATALSLLTFRLLERPWRDLPPLGRQWKIGLSAAMACALVGCFYYRTGGFPKRLSPHTLAYAALTEDWKGPLVATPECQKRYGAEQIICLETEGNKVPTMLLVGDSHANQFFPGLSPVFREQGENLINLGSVSCPAVFGVTEVSRGSIHRPCTAVSSALEMALARPEIHTVLLAARWQLYVPRNRGGEWALRGATRLADALRQTILRLQKEKKRVVVLLDAPDLELSLNDCIRPYVAHKDCSVSLKSVLERQGYSRSLVTQIAEENGAEIEDPIATYCDKERCYGLKPQPVYRADGSHLSVFGSKLFAGGVSGAAQNSRRLSEGP